MPVYLGDNLIDDFYLGDDQVDNIYLGASEAFSAGEADGPGPSEDTSGQPVSGFSVTDTGWMGCKLEWTQVDQASTLLQIQRKESGGEYPARDLAAARGWDNFFFLGMKSFHHIDLECDYNQTYLYRIRTAQKLGTNAWRYGPWSETTAVIPNFTEETVSLSSYDTTGATNNAPQLRTDWAAAKAITDADPNKVAVLDLTGLSGTIAVEGPSASDGNILDIDDSERIWLKGPGHTALKFQFWLPGRVDPEDNVIYKITPWSSGMSVTANDEVLAGDIKYKALDTGTAGSNQPTHTSGTWTDNNGIRWEWVSNPTGIQAVERGIFWTFGDAQWNQFSGIHFDGNCRPTGSVDWWTPTQAITGWDPNHKCFNFGFAGELNNYTKLDAIKATRWRGEIIYSGGRKIGKVLCKDCQIGETNGSAYSASVDMQIQGGWVRDCANACNESIAWYNGASDNNHNHMMIDVELTPRYYWLIEGNNPILINSQEGRFCSAVFNQPNSSILYDGVTASQSWKSGVYAANAQHNVAFVNCDFDDCVVSGAWGEDYIKTWIQNKSQYQLTGEMDNFLITGTTFDRSTLTNQCGSFIGPITWGAFPVGSVRITGNTFKVSGTKGPLEIFKIRYDHRASSLYQDIEISYNTGAPTGGSWGKRGGGGYARPKMHHNTWNDVRGDTGEPYNGAAQNATLDPIGDLVKLDSLYSTGTQFSMNNNTDEILDGAQVEIYGHQSGRVGKFLTSNSTLNLPQNYEVGHGDLLKLQFNASTQKWDFLSFN